MDRPWHAEGDDKFAERSLMDTSAAQYEQSETFSHRRELIISFFRLFIPMSLLLAAVFFAFSNQIQKYELQTILIQEEAALKSASDFTSLIFEQKLSDVLFVASGQILKKHLRDYSLESWASVAKEFSLFARRKPQYFQVRFIDNKGQEQVRVDSTDGTPFAVPPEKLQDKSSRYYFREAMNLAEGQVYVSPLDLNVEQGVIEQPIKPTIRFATPVMDDFGVKRGILVINYLPNELFLRIAELFRTLNGQTAMLNKDGYWLMGAPDEKLWGFMYGNAHTFASEYPNVWKAVEATDKGTFLFEDDMFVFRKAYPDRRNGENSLRVVGDRHWIFTSHVSKKRLDELSARRMNIALISYLLLFMVAALISVFFAKNSVQKKFAFHKLEQYATTDALTGTANRRELQKVARKEFRRAGRYGRTLSMMMLDIDYFKKVNDTFEHAVGDAVLKHIAKICCRTVRGQDLVTRYGGEEFAIVLPETDVEGTRLLAERIRRDVSDYPFSLGSMDIPVTVSIGVSEMASTDENFQAILMRADRALYQAKKQGRNRVIVLVEDETQPAALSG